MATIVLILTFLVFISGAIVLGAGCWRKMPLKFAGVAFSTSASFFYISMVVIHGYECNQRYCDHIQLHDIIRNIALLVFHITSGRDAIRFKGKDRRRNDVTTAATGKRAA